MHKFTLFNSPCLFCLFVIFFTGCKKTAESFDSPPISQFTASLTFTPEYTGTVSTNQPSIKQPSLMTIQNTGNSFYFVVTFNGTYTILNSTISQSVFFYFYVFTQPGTAPPLTTGTYLYTATSLQTNTGNLKADLSTPQNWMGYYNPTNAYYQSLPPPYSKMVITNIYTKKLKDATHTYADGSVEATYFGGDTHGVINTLGQAKIAGTFVGAEVKNY